MTQKQSDKPYQWILFIFLMGADDAAAVNLKNF